MDPNKTSQVSNDENLNEIQDDEELDLGQDELNKIAGGLASTKNGKTIVD
uniref:Uncharacterized protein n=1 Tax=Cyanothece sp. (strain PCC 7425 / ATCC 29141) TaxID=395961 RepID=B8HZ59_CYAP4